MKRTKKKSHRIRTGSIAYHVAEIGDIALGGLIIAMALFGPIVWYMQSTHPFL